MKRSGRELRRAVIASLVVFALIFSAAVFAMDFIGGASEEAQIEMVSNAVRTAVLTCYAVEGAYPPDIDHLVENYGLSYDADRYEILYDAFASNVFPDIRVSIGGGEAD